MEAARLAFDPVPPRPAHAELNQAIIVQPTQEPELSDDGSESSEGSFESFCTLTSDEDLNVITDEIGSLTMDVVNSPPLLPVVERPETGTDKSAAMTPVQSKPVVPPSTELDEANEWVKSYKASHPDKIQLSPANLRAYHLWYHQHFAVPQIIYILRDPPLKTRTVLDYICEAVYRGRLPADPESFAQMGSLGVEPVRVYHKQMLRAAVEETERRRRRSSETSGQVTNVGWWMKRDRI